MKYREEKILWASMAILIVAWLCFTNAFGVSRAIDRDFRVMQDSATLQLIAGDSIIFTSTRDSCFNFDTVITFGNDTLLGVNVLMYPGGFDSARSWYSIEGTPSTDQEGSLIGTPTWLWRVPVYAHFECDSIQGYQYLNGSEAPTLFVMTAARTGTQSYDSIFTTAAGTHLRLKFDFFPAGDTVPIPYQVSLRWDTLGCTIADTIYAPDTSVVDNVCFTYGYITVKGNQPLEDATVTFTLEDPDVDNSCDSTLLAGKVNSTRTGAEGYFSLDLIYSSCLGDQPYTMTVNHWSVEQDMTRRVVIPDSAAYFVF